MRDRNKRLALSGKLAATLVIVVMILSGVGMFGIYSQHRTVERAFEAVDRVRTIEFALRELEVDFKVEVQEWKNLLLRSQTPEGFAKWRATYDAQVQKTMAAFEELRRLPGTTPEEVSAIETAAAMHRTNAKLYTEALGGYQQNNPASVFATDELVRGKDRVIAETLDELGNKLRSRDEAMAAEARKEGEERYNSYRSIAGGISLVAIVLTLGLAFLISRLGHSQ